MATTVVILGSPRRSNSEAIAMAIANKAKAKGNTIIEHRLNQLKNVKGCQSCYGCKKTGRCVVKDDMIPVLEDVRNADSIILATPIYFGHSTAQYRMFEDRCFSFLGGDFRSYIDAGKKVVIVQTCGSGITGAEKNADEVENVWKNFFKADVIGRMVVGNMSATTAAADSPEIMAEAGEIGRKL